MLSPLDMSTPWLCSLRVFTVVLLSAPVLILALHCFGYICTICLHSLKHLTICNCDRRKLRTFYLCLSPIELCPFCHLEQMNTINFTLLYKKVSMNSLKHNIPCLETLIYIYVYVTGKMAQVKKIIFWRK